MRPKIILIIFKNTNIRNVVYEIIRKLKPEWHYSEYQLRIPGKLDDVPFIFATIHAVFSSKSFNGYNIIKELYYIEKFDEPEKIIHYIEKFCKEENT